MGGKGSLVVLERRNRKREWRGQGEGTGRNEEGGRSMAKEKVGGKEKHRQRGRRMRKGE